ncbi:hypothetical protein, partial [Citrobacter amalonaticus]
AAMKSCLYGIFIGLTSDSSDGAVCDEKVKLHGLDLSTKHEVIDSREPEMKKAAMRQPQSKYGCLHR